MNILINKNPYCNGISISAFNPIEKFNPFSRYYYKKVYIFSQDIPVPSSVMQEWK